ncbi:Noncompact myelin-associated protein [Vulpes lagopus]
MTTATPLGGTTFFSLNVTTREDFLYKKYKIGDNINIFNTELVNKLWHMQTMENWVAINSREKQGSGAIVAAIVVVVIIIFAVVLILLKMYNRKMRTRRELEPKGPKPASPSALGPNNNSSQHPATVTFSPVDVHVETR